LQAKPQFPVPGRITRPCPVCLDIAVSGCCIKRTGGNRTKDIGRTFKINKPVALKVNAIVKGRNVPSADKQWKGALPAVDRPGGKLAYEAERIFMRPKGILGGTVIFNKLKKDQG
jgi:hypothetical protein